MAIGIFINCKGNPFVDDILSLAKQDETRTRNVFKNLVGHQVYLIETGTNKVPVVKGTAVIESAKQVDYSDAEARMAARILGTDYDIKPGQKKWFYRLSDVKGFDMCFSLPEEHFNHGRSYTEFSFPSPLTQEMMDGIVNFIASCFYGCHDDYEFMSLDEAAYNIHCMQEAGDEIPAGLTPTLYAKLWNRFIKEEKEGKQNEKH